SRRRGSALPSGTRRDRRLVGGRLFELREALTERRERGRQVSSLLELDDFLPNARELGSQSLRLVARRRGHAVLLVVIVVLVAAVCHLVHHGLRKRPEPRERPEDPAEDERQQA